MTISNEHDVFHAFIAERFSGNLEGTSLEEALVTFRAYQRQLEKLKAHIQPSIAQADKGETQLLDLEAVMARVEKRIQGLH